MRDLTNVQKNTCVAIINIFETGEVGGDYSNVTSVEGDPGGLTYGKSQTTLMSGNLHALIESYCFTPGAKFADKLRSYLPQLKNRDRSLNHDEKLHEILESAGLEPLMQQVQDRFFDHAFWTPAIKQAQSLGIETALGTAVVYDSFIHGSWKLISDRTNQKFGAPAVKGEKSWIINYVSERRNWLANHPTIPLLHKTVYRMNAFNDLIKLSNWDLKLPIKVRGILISEATLNRRQRLLMLRSPYMRGADVKEVQKALVKAGYDIVADGIFGKATSSAVKAFQLQSGLIADGIVGTNTLAALHK